MYPKGTARPLHRPDARLGRLPSVVLIGLCAPAHSLNTSPILLIGPVGPLGFSAEDETTMEALTVALGRPLRFLVVASNGMVVSTAGISSSPRSPSGPRA